ncbi:MAG: SDR family oxidoreductase [Chloroflexota bacterium]
MGKLEGQVAIIFGASSGMGRATALSFAEGGAKVVVAARRAGRLEGLARQIEGNGGEVLALGCDVSKRADVDAVVAAAIQRWRQIDVVVNAAGTNAPDRRIAVVTEETWERIIAVNLTGAFHCTQAPLAQMRAQQNGLIVHITSISGKWGDNSGAAYQASKHGMVGLAYATMFEERQNGIRVSLIFPGLADTEILRNRPVPIPREVLDKAMQAEDIAAGCFFMASLPARTYVPELIMMPGALQCIGQGVV